MQQYDLIVIGTGVTGLAAARQAAQEGLATAMLETLFFGGLVTNINALDGEIGGSGSDVAAGMMMEASKLGAKNITASASGIARDGDVLVVSSDAGDHRARAVIIATGARLKRLGVPGEAEFEENGVSHCADCDGPFYKGQDVVVVGGGDSALQEALVLTEFARQVHLIHRGGGFTARQHYVDQVAGHANIVVHLNSQVDAILGEQSIRAVRVKNVGDDMAIEIACSGVFPYIGLEPVGEFAPAEIQRDAGGHLMTDAGLQSAMPGVFAAGAVRAGYGGMLSHALSEGIAAANAAAAAIRA